LWRTTLETVVPCLGWALLVAAFAGPAAWPWYFCWGIVLLAATPKHQPSTLLLVLAGPVVLLVKANGILALPLQSAPYVLLAYVLVAAAFALAWRRGRRTALRRHPDRELDPGASSMLAES
ncbi:MAG: hypothetical protein JWM85_2389, partial [Acidimicrobiaceae bacterium]|nr:hypothetical protein [Acidimicrobiaceae bacterium]